MTTTVVFPAPETVVIFDDELAATPIVIDGGTTAVVLQDAPVEVILGSEGPQGPTGPTGPTGPAGPNGTELTSKTAAQALGGHRVVKIDSNGLADYADPTVAYDALAVLGITVEAVAGGDPVNIRQFGEIVEPSWNWTVGHVIYAGLNGVLTQVPPLGAVWLRTVGVATAATKIVVALQPPIYVLP